MEKAIVSLNKTEYNETTLNLNSTPLTITSINLKQYFIKLYTARGWSSQNSPKKKKLSSINSGWLSIPLAQIITFHDAPKK